MTPHADLLVDLIRYVRSIQGVSKVALSIPGDDVLLRQFDERDLDGVTIDVDDDVWLRVSRLDEPEPPVPPPSISNIIEGSLDDVEHPPSVAKPLAFKEQPGAEHEHGTSSDSMEILGNDEPLRLLAMDWVENEWQSWAEAVSRVHASNAFYRRLFEQMTHLKLEGGAETLEIVCGIGMARWVIDKGTVSYPLFIQVCEVFMPDDGMGTMEIRPASTQVEVALDVLSSAGIKTAALAKSWLDGQDNLPEIMCPFSSEVFVPLLSELGVRLDPQMGPVGQVDSKPGSVLSIDPKWMFFVRSRPNDRLIRDLEALEQAVRKQASSIEDGNSPFPRFLQAMVDKTVTCSKPSPSIAWRGIETLSSKAPDDVQVEDLYFPLPYNEEQAKIIDHLETGAGAIVQGPPGTGKSHTIANVICHYLAHGKRILVAASQAGALEVIHDKLPPSIKSLAAPLLSSDAQSLTMFEKSLSEIEYRLSSMDHASLSHRISENRATLDAIHRHIHDLDGRIEQIMEPHYQRFDVCGQQMTAVDVVREWLSFQKEGESPVIEGDVPNALPDDGAALEQCLVSASSAHHAIGDLLAPYLRTSLPQDLPSPEEASEMAHVYQKIQAYQKEESAGLVVPVCSEMEEDDVRHFQAQSQICHQAHQQVSEFIASQGDEEALWSSSLRQVLDLPIDDPVWSRLEQLLPQLENAWGQYRELDGRVQIRPNQWVGSDPVSTQARSALDNLAQGMPAFKWWQSPFKSDVKALIDAVRVDGATPSSPAEWGLVKRRIGDFQNARRTYQRWNSLIQAMGLPKPRDHKNMSDSQRIGNILKQARGTEMFRCFHHEQLPLLFERVSRISPVVVITPETWQEVVSLVLHSLEALPVHRLNIEREAAWEDALSEFSAQGAWPEIQVSSYRKVAQDAPAAHLHWTHAAQEATLITTQQKALAQLETCIHEAQSLGFGGWADQWLSQPSIQVDGWRHRWRQQVLGQIMAGLSQQCGLEEVLCQRKDQVSALSQCMEHLVADSAWLGMAQHATPDVRRALKDYAASIRKQGSGQGKRASRHRANAREAMRKAFSAIPCWIMPHGRVCESMPAVIGLFDLVIIDEASQSDIQSLPSLLRAKKLLVVGDDCQVSPAAVGMSEDSVIKLISNDLSRQPYSHLLLPDRSIYDLFNVVFSGLDVMLREHFRSVEPIIAYSNRNHYKDQILPLRMPRLNERMTPPLIDVVVEDGVFMRDINCQEADWIADEISRIVNDPDLAQKSIGVVTLTSNDKQSIQIREAISSYIDANKWMLHNIAVGPPSTFQGKERDIMFVSMVWDGRNKRSGPSNSVLFNQRFNVALSRARDRMYLVRSNHERPFSPSSPLTSIISHFDNPIPEKDLNAVKPSVFCATLSRHLINMGYRVWAHSSSAALGLDIVVEDQQGHRMAIQCDGDSTPGSSLDWRHRLHRQRILERAGWSIWRGLAASFTLDKDLFLSDMKDALMQHEIHPLNGECIDLDAHVEHRLVKSSLVDVAAESDIESATEDEHDEVEGNWSNDANTWPTDRETLLALCDPNSPFEREVMTVLLDYGYRVHPQYNVGPYRLDMLVQSLSGKRLVIECDGDSFHGLDRHDQDKARQKWIQQAMDVPFWRCWYSDWSSDKASCVDALLKALQNAGVEPFEQIAA